MAQSVCHARQTLVVWIRCVSGLIHMSFRFSQALSKFPPAQRQLAAEVWAWRERLQRSIDGCSTTDDMLAAGLAAYDELDGLNVPVSCGFQVRDIGFSWLVGCHCMWCECVATNQLHMWSLCCGTFRRHADSPLNLAGHMHVQSTCQHCVQAMFRSRRLAVHRYSSLCSCVVCAVKWKSSAKLRGGCACSWLNTVFSLNLSGVNCRRQCAAVCRV